MSDDERSRLVKISDKLPLNRAGQIRKLTDRARLLVVDDEEAVRELMAEVLRLDGHTVTVAAGGEEALELWREREFDVTFVDLVMPRGMAGLQVVKRIKELAPEADIVVVTGFATIEVAVESMRMGAIDFITKPFSNAHLQLVVSKVLERRNLVNAAAESEHYKRLSRQDGLTGLYNHRFFHQLIDSEVSRAKRFQHKVALLILDLDHFKQLNDSHGHLAGDAVLRQLAELLRVVCRKYDFAARYGGEEFAIISPGNDSAQASALAERLRSRIAEERFGNLGQTLRLTASIGVASIPEDAREKLELIEKADQALYAAKERGRNCTVRACELDNSCT
jgi:diguanylate cyclase (GGDEF)-like protein